MKKEFILIGGLIILLTSAISVVNAENIEHLEDNKHYTNEYTNILPTQDPRINNLKFTDKKTKPKIDTPTNTNDILYKINDFLDNKKYAFHPKSSNRIIVFFYSSTNDGYILNSNSFYPGAWISTTGTVYDWLTTQGIGQAFQNNLFFIVRDFVFFDTSSIPDSATINSATLSLYGCLDRSDPDFNIVIQNGQPTYPHNPLQSGDYYKGFYSGNGGQFHTASFTTSGYNVITLNADGRSWINKAGYTKLCLRSDREIAGVWPTSYEDVGIYSAEWGGSYRPKLTVDYTALPDLTVTDLWVSPSSFCPLEYVDVYGRVKNIGAGAAGAFDVEVMVDGTSWGEVEISGLAPGSHVDVYLDDVYWNNYATVTFEWIADSNNEITETNENNNNRIEQFAPGQPVCDVSTNSINFGTWPEGSSVPDQTFKVRNAGECTLEYTITDNANWFSEYPTSGSSTGEWDTITVSASIGGLPPGIYTGKIFVEGNPGGTETINVQITIEALPQITLTPASWNFGDIEVGSWSVYKAFQLKNIGGGTAQVNVYLSGQHSNQFECQNPGTYYLNAGQTVNINVRFKPTSAGYKTATLEADGVNCNDASSQLSGTGVLPPPELTLTPAGHDFGDVLIGQWSPEFSFTLTNVGGDDAQGSISLDGPNATEFQITSATSFYLLAGQSTPVKVRFGPTSVGLKNATLKVDGDPPCNDPEAWLLGTGKSHPPNTPSPPAGPDFGYLDMPLNFTASTLDPDGDNIFYKFDWGDGTSSSWLGPYGSGAMVTAGHTWSSVGSYNVRVKAKDTHNVESGWSGNTSLQIYDITLVPHYAVVIGEWDYPGTSDDIPESYFNAFGIFSRLNRTNEWDASDMRFHTNRGSSGVLSDLTWMKNLEDADSLSVFYYSGHGGQVTDDNGDESDGYDEVLICSDNAIIRDDALKTMFDGYDGFVIVILESCNAGGMPSFFESDDGLGVELQGENRVIMMACAENEDCHTGGGLLSLFTHYIGQGWSGLADENDNDEITDEETFNYSSSKVLEWQEQHTPPWTQTPQLYDGYAGEIPLIVSGWGLNLAPNVPTDPIPLNGAVNTSVDLDLSCNVSDPNGDNLSVAFYWETGDDDDFIGFVGDVASGSRVNISVSDLLFNTTYEWYVVVTDGMNLSVSPVWSFTTNVSGVSSVDIVLSVGWNLISVPFVNGWSAKTLAENISGCSLVSWFNASSQMFESYIVGGPPSFDFPILDGWGYFVFVDQASVFTVSGYPIASVSVPLEIGWNMIGWYHPYDTWASSLAENISGCSLVSWFNASSQMFESYIVGGPPSFDFLLSAGMGVMVWVNVASVWHGEG